MMGNRQQKNIVKMSIYRFLKTVLLYIHCENYFRILEKHNTLKVFVGLKLNHQDRKSCLVLLLVMILHGNLISTVTMKLEIKD